MIISNKLVTNEENNDIKMSNHNKRDVTNYDARSTM